jgi:hypothetical protein
MIRGPLYLVSEFAWNRGLCFIDHRFATAKIEVSPGWFLGRPHFPDVQSRDRWLEQIQPTEVPEAELDDATRERIALHDLMG